MFHIEFPPTTDLRYHACHTVREGDWIIYRCSKCHDYERRYNVQTGKMQTKGHQPHVRHWGIHNEANKNSRLDLN